MIYAWIGRKTVRLASRYLRRRYGGHGRVALGVGLAAAAAGAAYLATREVPEG
ncbi:MAG: hypothetical protein M3335_03155 [Actinomycetota bacterium]|nr:hypothetical protein [Actinomycetota bacterium]